MRFSLRWLFAVIAIAAIFSAAIIYRTPFWTLTAVNLTVVILFVGSFGLWFQRLNQTFWVPFCAVGWFYFVFALIPQGIHRLHAFLPGTQLTHTINEMELAIRHSTETAQREWATGIHNLFDILNSCSALLAGTLAGVISAVLLRQKREA